ncbi:MAG: hypothetical protein AB1705_09840 [Verrucomicrobiota bacterium]
MTADRPILVCFAVKEEAAPFRRSWGGDPRVRILITGMGFSNTERAVRSELNNMKPCVVITSGFAGGLNPDWQTGQVVFDAPETPQLAAALAATGAFAARFHCATRVAATADEKRALRESTGCDVVEMESGTIREICRSRLIPSLTIRVISDAVDENLPLDFNQLMTADQRMDFAKLALALLKSPGKIPALMRFQKRLQQAANNLAGALDAAIKVQLGIP